MTSVLLVDDEEPQRFRLRHLLAAQGYDVLEAADGEQALQVLREHLVQIVVTDWSMPVMDGLELCRAIRERVTTYVYIIFLTSHKDTSKLVEALTCGANDYLTKPVHPAELTVRIQAAERTLVHLAKDTTLFALAKLAESRDPDTGQHLERVQAYCKLLADHLLERRIFPEIDAPFAQLLFETSPLHDIGKVAIPDGMLLKHGKLSPSEFELMKTHTIHGATTLRTVLNRYPTARFLRMAADIAEFHHEKFNGTGYPRGLAGEAIPLPGRIVALVDVYDALTSRRCYKDAYSAAVSREMILQGSGNHFDPRIVEAFQEVEPRFIEIHQSLSANFSCPTI